VTYHFGSKATLYEEALRYSLQPLVERITEAASTRGTPTERILAVATTHFSFLSDRPQLRQLFLQLLQEEVTIPERVAALARQVIGTVGQLVVEGQRDGTIRSGDPRLLTVAIMAQPIMLNVLRPMLRVGPQIDLDDPETRERALSNALRFIRAGLDPATEV
jgi:AcrR family transcriptional regulator